MIDQSDSQGYYYCKHNERGGEEENTVVHTFLRLKWVSVLATGALTVKRECSVKRSLNSFYNAFLLISSAQKVY
jgi:hypothetical protein